MHHYSTLRSGQAAILLSLLALGFATAADESTRGIQQTLKAKGFYFGEPNGERDEATQAALRRFQIREGLAATGETDAATLKALQGKPAPDAAPPVSSRDRAQSVVRSDREFLQELEASDPPASAPPPRREMPAPPSPAPRVERPAIVERPATIERPARIERAEPLEPLERPVGVSEEEAQRFVRSYLSAAEMPSPERELSFYGDTVDYFDNGRVNRDFVEKDQLNYYRRWTERDFKLLEAPLVERVSDRGATVRFRIRYALRGKGGSVTGEAENVMRLARAGQRLEIVGIRERKLRD